MKTGHVAFTLGEQIIDTIKCHGFEWALAYYTKAGVARWEFDCLIEGQANLAADALTYNPL
jgi:hypothetical protein